MLCQYTPPMRLNYRVELSSWVASASVVWTKFVISSRRLPTDSVDNLETDQTDSIAVWVREFWTILITFSTMTSWCRHLSSIVQQYRKLQTGSRLPTGAFTPSTRLNSTVESRRRCVLDLEQTANFWSAFSARHQLFLGARTDWQPIQNLTAGRWSDPFKSMRIRVRGQFLRISIAQSGPWRRDKKTSTLDIR